MATPAAPGSLKLQGKVRNLQSVVKLILAAHAQDSHSSDLCYFFFFFFLS